MANFPIEIMVKLTYNMCEVIIMAEFCLECFKKINGPEYEKRKYVLTKELNFCEECGEMKRTVFMERDYYCMRRLNRFITPVQFIFAIINFILRHVFLPFFTYVCKTRKKGNKTRKMRQFLLKAVAFFDKLC